ncbi:MAG: peptide deformylase [Bacteroidaceae bacterium]|nr:peptide deformylase [Bacteroidaceae bacterium]
MILPIYTYGLPVLRKEAEEVPENFPELPQLVQDMFDTLDKSEGVGLAAPQIGKSLRLIVVNLDPLGDDVPEYKGFRHAYVNPQILEYGPEQDSYEEGCLSLPGITESVKRPTSVLLAWEDTDGTEHEEWIKGFHARVIQHECDHLDGKVFTDRLSPLRKQFVKKKLTTLAKGRVSCNYKVKTPR